jgi:hypothetical protein
LGLGGATIPLRRVEWPECWRIIPSRYPPIDLFERVAPPEDWELLIELESRTNDRLRDQVGQISLIPLEERMSGPGTSFIMAPFTHLHPDGSRFTDGTYGAYYGAAALDTAVAETCYHRARFFAATATPATTIDMRVLINSLSGDLHDIRGLGDELPGVYDPVDYSAGQALGRQLHGDGAFGIVYDSVRHDGGHCAAVFRPRSVLTPVIQERHLSYHWDGTRIAAVNEIRALQT